RLSERIQERREQSEGVYAPRKWDGGLTMTSASRQAKNRARATSQMRAVGLARRGFARCSRNRASCFRRKRLSATNGCLHSSLTHDLRVAPHKLRSDCHGISAEMI